MAHTAMEIYDAARHSVANIIAIFAGERVGSGTGFLVNGKIVTCAHVAQVPHGCKLEVNFELPATGATQSWTYDTPPFKGCSDEHSFDFAILDVPGGVTCGPSLVFSERHPVAGEPVCLLGYPFEDPHLTIHQGIVSAVYKKNGPATMLKLDMSVNPSNSGGPLISMIDGKVLGVVARRATGLTIAFDQLMQRFDDSINACRAAAGYINISGMMPFEIMATTQEHMKTISAELQRSANVGIGYAIWVDPLRHEAALNS